MPFCPKCEAEYNKGIVKCSDCDILLVDVLPVKQTDQTPVQTELEEKPFLNDKFEILYTANNEFDLIFYSNVLRKNGIESIVNSPKYYGNFNNIGLTSEHHLLVNPSEMERAREIIEGVKADNIKAEEIKGWENTKLVEPQKVPRVKKEKGIVDRIYIIILIILFTLLILYKFKS